jgi:hypothetical protein
METWRFAGNLSSDLLDAHTEDFALQRAGARKLIIGKTLLQSSACEGPKTKIESSRNPGGRTSLDGAINNNFVRSCAEHLARASGRQKGKFEHNAAAGCRESNIRLIGVALSGECNDLGALGQGTIGGPSFHKLAALLQCVAAAVGLLGLVANDMR